MSRASSGTAQLRQIFVSNRSFERAEALAAITGGRAVRFGDWEREFQDLDVLVSSTAAPHVILTPEKLAPLLRARRHRPLFMIDLAIPRDIDPAIHNLDGVYLYDLDALQRMAERTLQVRRQEAENCHRLIEQHVLDFQLWIERTTLSGNAISGFHCKPNPPPIAAPPRCLIGNVVG